MLIAVERLRARLKELLKANELEDVRIAEVIGRDASWISTFLRSEERDYITVEMVDKIATFLNIDVQLLFSERDLSRHTAGVQPAGHGSPDASHGSAIPEQSEEDRLNRGIATIAKMLEALANGHDIAKTGRAPRRPARPGRRHRVARG